MALARYDLGAQLIYVIEMLEHLDVELLRSLLAVQFVYRMELGVLLIMRVLVPVRVRSV